MVNASGQNRQWQASLEVQVLVYGKLDLKRGSGEAGKRGGGEGGRQQPNTETNVRRSGPLAAGLLLAVACSSPSSSAKRPATERQRDSVIGASKLPGASGVRGALRVQDSAAARNTRIDSAGN